MSTLNRDSETLPASPLLFRIIRTGCLVSPAIVACTYFVMRWTDQASAVMWKASGISASVLLLICLLLTIAALLFETMPLWVRTEARNFFRLSMLMLFYSLLSGLIASD